MSYEPTLVIRQSDLEKNRKVIEDSEYKTHRKEETTKAWTELRKILNQGTIEFPELTITIAKPEGTNHSNNVRSLLKKLHIEFRQDV